MQTTEPGILEDPHAHDVIDDPFEAFGAAILTLLEEMKRLKKPD